LSSKVEGENRLKNENVMKTRNKKKGEGKRIKLITYFSGKEDRFHSACVLLSAHGMCLAKTYHASYAFGPSRDELEVTRKHKGNKN
jgi:hypothetical protein